MKSMRHIMLLCLMAIFVASCTKDVVGPCGVPDTNGKSRTNGVLPTDPSNPALGPTQGAGGTSEPAVGSDPNPTGISDDGDDISDSEKSRRKRR